MFSDAFKKKSNLQYGCYLSDLIWGSLNCSLNLQFKLTLLGANKYHLKSMENAQYAAFSPKVLRM